MATATYTTHYNWVQPALGGDPTTWGSEINTSLGAIDSQVWTNDQKVTTIQGYLGPHSLLLSRQGAVTAGINFYNADAAAGQQSRWQIYMDAQPEGGNANSNLIIQCENDGGAYLGWAMQFNRATQRVQISQTPVVPNDIAHKGYVDGQITAAVNAAGAAVAANHGVLPVGSIIMWPTGSSGGAYSPIPPGWVQCFGQHYKITDMPALAGAIGGYWFWDGTNFGIPNLIGRFPIGHDGTTNGGNGYYVGLLGGEAYHTLSLAELPYHDHSFSQNPHSHTYTAAGAGHPGLTSGGAFGGNYTNTTDQAYANIGFVGQGNNAGHYNVPPFAVVTFLIRYA